MASGTEVKRSQLEHRLCLFDAGVAALSRTAPGAPPDCYLCPLCLRYLTRASVAARALTMEHVPPAAVGGTRMLLTCVDCNNASGVQYDSHMAPAEAYRTFGTPESTGPIEATVTLDGVSNRGLVKFDGRTLEHVGIEKRNDPRVLAQFGELLPTLGKGADVEVSFTGPSPESFKRAAIGWLRSAYLATFSLLGYRYTLRSELDVVREAIATGRTDLVPVVTRPEWTRQRIAIVPSAPDWLAGSVVVIQDATLTFLPSGRRDCDVLARLIALKTAAVGQIAGFDYEVVLGWPKHPEYRADQ